MFPNKTGAQVDSSYAGYYPTPQYYQQDEIPMAQIVPQQPVVVEVVPDPNPAYATPVYYPSNTYQQPMYNQTQPIYAQPVKKNRVVLTLKPTYVVCPNCNSSVKTNVPAPTWPFIMVFLFFIIFGLTVYCAVTERIILLFIVFFGGFFGTFFLMMPFILKKKKVSHICPLCLHEIGTTGTVIEW